MSLRTFTAEAVKNFHRTAAIAPSSRFLTRAMVDPLPLAQARRVVELGPGTGVITRALLARLPTDARLYCFEISPRFQTYLRNHFSDPRLVVVPESAEHVAAELGRRGVTHVDAAVSSLGLSLFADPLRRAVLRELVQVLKPDGVFTQYQYLNSLITYFRRAKGRLSRFTTLRLLREHFNVVESQVVWRNIPPAFVYSCRRAAA